MCIDLLKLNCDTMCGSVAKILCTLPNLVNVMVKKSWVVFFHHLLDTLILGIVPKCHIVWE